MNYVKLNNSQHVLPFSYYDGNSMKTTKLSSKGQVILPSAIRSANQWKAGVEFSVENTSEGVLLRPIKAFAATTLDEVVGCTGYAGKSHSVTDINKSM